MTFRRKVPVITSHVFPSVMNRHPAVRARRQIAGAKEIADDDLEGCGVPDPVRDSVIDLGKKVHTVTTGHERELVDVDSKFTMRSDLRPVL